VSIVDGVLEELKCRGVGSPSAVHLRVGRLSGVDKEALEFSYRMASEETALAGSDLMIEDVEVSVWCPVCAADRPTRSFPLLECASCGAMSAQVTRGMELEITGVEISE
jgi:hydrogenase nickel incorporation protein HypA/HybF